MSLLYIDSFVKHHQLSTVQLIHHIVFDIPFRIYETNAAQELKIRVLNFVVESTAFVFIKQIIDSGDESVETLLTFSILDNIDIGTSDEYMK